MNERYKEIATIAADWCVDNITVFPVSWEWEKKYAELIIKECCHAYETEVDTWQNMEPYQGSIKRKGVSAIRVQFGLN